MDADFVGQSEIQLQDGREGIHFAESKVHRLEIGDQLLKFGVCGC